MPRSYKSTRYSLKIIWIIIKSIYTSMIKNLSTLCCGFVHIFKKKPQLKAVALKTPRAGFEPATNRLTVDRSTAELPRIATRRTYPSSPPTCKGLEVLS